VAGQFLWTGIDYLGEANRWPNRANGAGLLDLCGFKKPNAWFRQSLWSDEPMVYVCASARRGGGRRFWGVRGEERWNWPDGATVTVTCFTNCPQVRLTLNDREIGTTGSAETSNGAMTWQVPYESGTLKAVGFKNGEPACEYALRTAGTARRIELLPDAARLRADGKDVCHVEFRIVDDRAVRVPDADNEVTFAVEGPGAILGIGNADLNSADDCTDRVHKAYRGRGLLVLQTRPEQGTIHVTARADGLGQTTARIEVLSE